MATVTTPHITLEEFLKLEAEAPEGVTLELIEGKLVERPSITTRGRLHAFVLSQLVFELVNWCRQDHATSFEVGSGEARCRLSEDSESIVGIDSGVWAGHEYTFLSDDPPLYEGPPVVAAEILSPSDTVQGVSSKTELYLKSGVRQVWILDPVWKTVTVFRKGQKPILLGDDDLLSGEGELPGFSVPVSRFFGKLKDVASPSQVH